MKELLILVFTGVLAMFTEILQIRRATFPLVVIGLALALGVSVYEMQLGNVEFIFDENPMLKFNGFTLGFISVLTFLTLVWYVLAHRYFESEAKNTDFHALIIFSLIGAVIMVSFTDMIMFFLGLEILSIPLYVLAGSRKLDLRSNEAAFKYFLMGAFASAFTLMGIALIYGATGSFNLGAIAETLARLNLDSFPLVIFGVLILTVGLCFKIAAAPFHFWAPDVYQGAPTPVTAFMAVIVKTAAIAALFILLNQTFTGLSAYWIYTIAAIAGVSIILGNASALFQENVKRILAFSSVAHAGYLLLAIVAGLAGYAAQGLLYYTAAYGCASLVLFFTLYYLSRNNGNNTEISAFDGLGKKHPVLAGIVSISLLSLAGIPPTAGFMAKYLLFSATIEAGFVGLVIIGVLGSLISLYYYLKIIIAMYFNESSAVQAPDLTWHEEATLLFLTGLILLLGVMPNILI